jgi:hypothetical protein
MATKWTSPTWRMPEESNQSKFENYSLSFDGSAFINCGNIISLQNTSVLTISMWFNLNTLTTQRMLGHYTTNNGITIESDSSFFYFVIANSSLTYATLPITGNVNINNWFNIIMVYDGNQSTNETKLKAYLNNQKKTLTYVGTIPTSLAVNNSANLRLGSTASGYVDMDGKLDQVAIFDYALSQSQINYLYNSGTPQNPMAISGNAPVAYYPLGGSSTGSSSSLTTPNSSVPSATVFDFVPNDFIDAPVSALNSTANFTVSFWGQRDTTSTTFGVGSKNSSTNRMFLSWFSDNVVYFNCKSGSDQSAATYSGLTSTDTNWHHYVGVFEGGVSQKLYVDGVLRSTITSGIPATTYATMGDDFNIGLVDNTSYSDGKISNAQIWTIGLSATEITTLYNYGSPLSGTQPQAANLKAWYKMGIDTSNWDGNNWQLSNSAANYSTALDFDGSSDYINCGTDSSLNTSALTVSCWVKCDPFTPGVGPAIISKDAQSGTNRSFGFLFVFGSMLFQLFDSSGTDNQASVPQASNPINTDGQWHHLVATVDGTTNANGIKVYIDNVLVAQKTASATGIRTSTAPFFIGGSGSTGTTFNWDGEISNVAIFNTALTSAQVQTLYNNGSPEVSISHSPISWWKLDNTTTGIQDSGSASNNGTNNGATQVSSLVSTLNGTSLGMTTANLVNSDLTRSIPYSSYSMDFDGTGDYIECGSSSYLNSISNLTVSAWVNAEDYAAGANGQFLVNDWNYNTANGHFRFYLEGGKLKIGIKISSSDYAINETNAFTFTNGEWYHVAFVYNGALSGSTNITKLYVNGINQSITNSYETMPTSLQNSSSTINIARFGSTSPRLLNGKMSNVAIWSSSLTEDQMLTIYNGGVPNDISSLSPTGWWSLAGDSYYDGTDFICPDLSTNSNNGTSSGMGGTELVGNGPGSTANGIATGMNIPANLQGNAPNSTKNAFSINMAADDKTSSVPDISS